MSSPAPKLRKRKSSRNKHQHLSTSPDDALHLSPPPPTQHIKDLSHSPDLGNDALSLEETEDLALVPVKSITKLAKQKLHVPKPKGVKRKTGFIFFLGGLFGLVVAGVFAQKNDLLDLGNLAEMSGVGELGGLGGLGLDSVEGWLNVLPEGFLKDAKELKVCFPFLFSRSVSRSETRDKWLTEFVSTRRANAKHYRTIHSQSAQS